MRRSPRLDLGTFEASPGATLIVRGTDMGVGQPVVLVLAGGTAELPLGTMVADGDGDFTRAVRIPIETTVGVYAVRALVGARLAARAPLAVTGAPGPTVARTDQLTKRQGSIAS